MRTFINTFVLALASSLGAAVTTNVWQNTESGEFSVETLSNWGLPDSPQPDWKSSFGFLDFRNLVPGSTVGCTTNVIVDGMWFAPSEGETEASWTVRRYTTENWWVFQDGAELRVDGGGVVDFTSQVQSPKAGNVVRKTGEGRLVLNNTWGKDRANQTKIELEEGSLELVHGEVLHDATLLARSSSEIQISGNSVKIGRVHDECETARDMDGKTAVIGRWGDSDLRVPWTNGRLVSQSGSLLHFGSAPVNVALEVANGDIVVDDLPEVWRDCVGFWRFNLADNLEFDSGFQFNQLVSSGTPKPAIDAERGPVLELDGNSGFKGRWSGSLRGGPTGSDAYTVACWIKVDPSANAGKYKMCVFKFGTLEANKCSFAGVCDMGNTQLSHSHGGSQSTSLNASLAATAWRHLAIVHDGASHMAYYVDGVLVDTVDWSSISGPLGGLGLTAKDFQIGLAWSEFASNFVGYMDDFAMFRRALSAAEVAALKDATQTVRPYAENQPIALTGTGQLHLLGDQTLTTLADDGSALPIGGVNLVNGAKLTAKTSADARFSGRISGEGIFEKDGPGRLMFTGAATQSGATKVKEGTLALRDIQSAQVGEWSFDEADRPWADASVNQITLAPNNASLISHVEDPARGGAVRITKGGYLKGALPTHFPSGASAYTASIWVKRSASCGNEGTFFVWGKNTVSKGQVQFRFYKSFQTLAFAHYGGGLDFTNVNLPAPLAPDTWYHLVATYDGVDKFRVYLDGVQVFERTNTTLPDVFVGGEIQLGSCWGNTSRWFDGCLDDMRVWGRALSADEVAALHRGEAVVAGTMDRVPRPVAWYRFDDPENPGRDSSGNGYDMTVVGTPQIVDSPVVGKWLSLEETTARSGLEYRNGDATCPEKIPSGAESITIAAWARLAAAERGVNGSLVFMGAGSPAAATILDTNWGNSGEAVRFVTLTDGNSTLTTVANDGAFIQGSDRQRLHFIVGVYDANAGQMSLYVDGALVENKKSTKKSISRHENFMIGCRFGNTSWLKGACLDEVRVFDVALSKAQIRLLMRQDLARGGLTVFPSGAAVDVMAGACLDVGDGIAPEVSELTGSGTLNLRNSDFTVTASSVFAGRLSGTGTIRLAPDVTLTLTQGQGDFPTTRVVALPSADGKERRIFATTYADGSCVLKNAVVPHGTLLLFR